MIYKNTNIKKIKNSHILIVSCGHCKADIVKYQKKGKGTLLRLYLNRITAGTIDFSKNLICPKYNNKIGDMITLKNKNKKAYKMIRSAYNTREAHFK